MIGVLIPIFLIQSIGVGLDLLQLKSRYEGALQTQAALVTDLVGESLVLPLWDFDMELVDNLVASVLKEGSIGRAELLDLNGKIISESQAEWYEKQSNDLSVSHTLRYSQNGQSEQLGELVVVLNTDSVANALMQLVFQKLVISVAILTLIAIALFAVLSRLARPLVAMSGTIRHIGEGNLTNPIPGMGRNDEIGLVAHALDQWRINEAEVAEFRAQHTEIARRERRRIRRALESTRDAVLLLDEHQLVVFCNPNAVQFFGGVKIGEPFDVSRWLDQKASRQINDAIKAEKNFQLETVFTMPQQDRQLNLLIRGGPIQDENGESLGCVILATDHTEQARQAERAKYLSEHDSLTNLPNRRLLEETLHQWVHEDHQDASILLADLDHFKLINDTLGHPVGDSLLRRIALVFGTKVKPGELAARLGGDEFAILVKGTDSETRLREIAEGLVEELSQPQHVEGRVLHTGMSVGIATVRKSEPNALDGIRRADLALYEAKNKGRARVEVFHSDLEAVVKRKSLLDNELRKALRNREIFPVYQVQTDLVSGLVVGFETLARWKHPSLGIISPSEFVPIAEETGLISELTYQIMTQACETAVEWQAHGFDGRIAINLSPKLFGAQIEEFVSDCLLISGCPASAIEVEITETVVLANGTSARLEIESLQRLGVTIALDDFGMGYSSLSYLQKFPVDKIKIDRAFVSKMPESAETRAIVAAITDLGHALGMRVTGEGAETEEHRNCLRDCNVDFLQGYVDGLPMTKAEATALVRASCQKLKAS